MVAFGCKLLYNKGYVLTNPCNCFVPEKHISIQRTLADLEKLADLQEGCLISAASQNADHSVAGI